MIFVTGPLYAGKQETICALLHWKEEDFQKKAIRDVQDLARDAGDLQALADSLSKWEVVIATEVGGGVVPVDPKERMAREKAGKLGCCLSQRASTVIRVCCGLPQILKGELP